MYYSLTNLNTIQNDELKQVFHAIAASDRLRWRNPGSKKGADLAKIFANFPSDFSALILYWNNIPVHFNKVDRVSGNELANILATTPKHLTGIEWYWSHNTLNKNKTAVAKILTELTAIELHWDILDSKSLGIKLNEALTTLPYSVTSFNLQKSNLNTLSLEDIEQLKDISSHLENLHLSKSEVSQMSIEQCAALDAVFTNIKKIILLDKNDEIVECVKTLSDEDPPSLQNPLSPF